MIKIRIPATTANIGPGFDTLGLALNLYNEFIFQEIDEGFIVNGFEEEYNLNNNLVYTSMMKTFELIDHSPQGVKIDAKIDIPISRGLGSSASCVLAGVIGANEIGGSPLDEDDILRIATNIEGHPDNITPALFGGLAVSIMDEEKVIFNRIRVHKGIKFLALVPDFLLSTEESRSVLPKDTSFKDSLNNVSRVSLLISALSNGRFELLNQALKDKLHQPYRGSLMPDFFNILEKVEEFNGLGAYLSGAGPTIMCIIRDQDKDFVRDINKYLQGLKNKWEIKELSIDLKGSQVIRKGL